MRMNARRTTKVIVHPITEKGGEAGAAFCRSPEGRLRFGRSPLAQRIPSRNGVVATARGYFRGSLTRETVLSVSRPPAADRDAACGRRLPRSRYARRECAQGVDARSRI